jgi:RimJ/RimL family protein N-acetyltransferase
MNSAPGAASAGVLLGPDRFTSQHLGRAVFRLTDPERARDALEQLSGLPRPLMVEAKIPVDQVATAATLTAQGFRLIDTSVQLDVPVDALRLPATDSPAWRVRPASAADRQAVETVSADNLTTSRFHLDPMLDKAAASRVKRAWVGNFFQGRRGDRLLVVDGDGRVGGFLLTLERDGEGIIDLVAIDPAFRGTGALEGLVRAWVEQAPRLTRLIVGTQVSNVRSLRAYARLGFRVSGASYVLHYHA